MSIQIVNGTLFFDHDDYTTSAATTNDLDIHSTCIIVIPGTNGDAITGFIGETITSGEMLWIINGDSTKSLVLSHDTGSTAGYRIYTPTATNLTLAPYEQAQLMYVDKVGRAGWWLKKDGTL